MVAYRIIVFFFSNYGNKLPNKILSNYSSSDLAYLHFYIWINKIDYFKRKQAAKLYKFEKKQPILIILKLEEIKKVGYTSCQKYFAF